MSSATKVKSSLEAQALAQFDSLVEKNELYWEPTEERVCHQEPFDVYFRVSPILTTKPYNPGDKSRKPGFLDDDPEFTLCQVEPAHKLILNKYCWVRPQMILHTREFQSQTDVLKQADFEATVSVLNELGDRYMAIFNGGPNAGSSVAHKHMQLFVKPDWRCPVDDIVDGTAKGDLPFRYTVSVLPSDATGEFVTELYKRACQQMSIIPGVAHSVILVKEWLLVMPRASATIQGEIDDAPMQGGANAMIGMLWLKTEEQYQNWLSYGPMKVLKEFGV